MHVKSARFKFMGKNELSPLFYSLKPRCIFKGGVFFSFLEEKLYRKLCT